MKLVVGLGNPGAEYQNTRHNLGFAAVDLVAAALDTAIDRPWLQALVGQGHYQGEKIILAKPQTYMNLSGASVQRLMRWYKLSPDDLTVIYDDLDLPPGGVRIRPAGGAGGHRGLTSVIGQLGTEQFTRIRLGIGRPQVQGFAVSDWVLSRFTPEEQNLIRPVLEKVPAMMGHIWEQGVTKAMNLYNRAGQV